jgi:hypothetical protein
MIINLLKILKKNKNKTKIHQQTQTKSQKNTHPKI